MKKYHFKKRIEQFIIRNLGNGEKRLLIGCLLMALIIWLLCR